MLGSNVSVLGRVIGPREMRPRAALPTATGFATRRGAREDRQREKFEENAVRHARISRQRCELSELR